MMSKELLNIKDLVIEYVTEDETVHAVNAISIKLDEGETLGLVGETGAGKTTTALGILRLIPNPPGVIRSGDITFQGKNLLELPEEEMRNIRGNHISMIFQDPMTSLNPVMTVGEQIAEVIAIHEGLNAHDAMAKAEEMLELVGIPAARSIEYPHQFSGGMKQRVVIAIALACNPKLLIADEPTTALDVTIQAQVLDLMGELKQKFSTAMILITHDLGVVAQVCDRVAIMYAGEIVESGTLFDVYEDTKHPYTIGLFGSIPNMESEVQRLKPINGLMPDPTKLPSGCKFNPRCPYAQDICREKTPPVTDLGNNHMTKCFLADGTIKAVKEALD
ncbi:MAG: ABC transporter ATP-binding protein [Fusobacteriaceae bacterium]|nr:ABC transporter ATP-binding protein [Fusobacteriaceae bacterium]